MRHPRALAQQAVHRAWLINWRVKDALAGVNRRVSAGAVALTFDDGPHPSSTGPVLDLLAELGVLATFFCVGRNAAAHPDLVTRILADGHALGSHSETHPHPAELSLRTLREDYRRGHEIVRAVAGRPVTLFRPPHGHLSPRSAVMIRRQGLKPWLWNRDPQDWRPGATVSEITAVASRVSSSDVVLLHDWVEQPLTPAALDRSATIAALPTVIRDVRDRGLVFTTLPT